MKRVILEKLIFMLYDVLMNIRYHRKQIALVHHKQQHFYKLESTIAHTTRKCRVC